MNLKTNIGKTFLKLIDKHFHKNHPLNKIINRKMSKSATVAALTYKT